MKNTRIYCLLAVVLLCGTVFSQTGGNGRLVSRTAYQKAPYEAVKGLDRLFDRKEYDEAYGDGRFVMENVKYISDGLSVSALLYHPKQPSAAKLPVIVFNRGGYIRSDIGHELLPMFYRFAKEGFIVVAPMYRGSDGAAGKDEVGGDDVNDLMNVVPLLRSIADADTKNVFLYGESRGGMMTFQAVRDGFPAKAAATYGGFTDFDELITSNPKLYDPLIKAIWPDFDPKKAEIVKRRSAIMWADKLGVPLLLMHGGSDKSVDPKQTLDLAAALHKLGKPYELRMYPGDNHSITANQKDRDARAAAWFKKHLKLKGN